MKGSRPDKNMQAGHDTMVVPEQPSFLRLTAEDWQIWRSLRLQALTEAPHAFGSMLADWQGPADLEARWRERLTAVPFNLVAFLNQCPVGMVSATEPTKDGTVELISLWVAPMGRGHGLGNALVEAVVQWAGDQGAHWVSLDVRESNLHATNLYLSHGFVDTGRRTQTSAEDPPERRFLRSTRDSR